MFKRRKPDQASDDAPGRPGWGDAPMNAESDAVAVPLPPPYPAADNGVGVPPYRPAAPKEAPVMGRTPFPAPNSPAVPPPTGPAPMPGMASPQPRPGVPPNRTREPAERRTLVVGRGISLQGTVADAERLVVEGTVEASMIQATELSIAQGGIFKGEVEVEDAEIAGVIDGTLTARGNLIVRATGKVLGTARCRRLQVEDGGQITGRIEMIQEGAVLPPRGAEPAMTSSALPSSVGWQIDGNPA